MPFRSVAGIDQSSLNHEPDAVKTAPRHSGGIANPPRAVWWPIAALFILAVPIFLISSHVLQTTRDLGFYERQFATHGVGERTGLSPTQLRQVAQRFIEYFDGPPRPLDIQVEMAGSSRSLLNEREVAHMQDVQALMRLVRRLQILAGGTIVAITVLGLVISRLDFMPRLADLFLGGAALTVGVLLVLGGLSLFDFSQVFVQFHELSFSNDLWMLDPRRDYLIMLFPEGFWFDATMRIALFTLLEALALAAIGAALRRWAPA